MATQELHQHIDRYVIRRVLGTGAMGSVYAAWDPKLHREVALKLVPARLSHEPKGRERFAREARAIAAVRHPNIVEIYDYSGFDSPHLYLVIEKLDGQDLYATLHRNGIMGEAVAVAVAHELCLALQVLHEAGIIHRDLKPENVFLNQNGRVVLTDFGIVKAVRDHAAVDGFRESTDVIGTPGFMAPELMRGRNLGPATDIFALGVLLYNITTKHLPFEGNTPLDIFKAAAAGRYPDPRKYVPTLSPEFCDIIHACLQPNARQRPRSAEVLRQALKAVIEDLGAVDVRDDLHDYSKNSAAFAQFARARAVAQVLSRVKVAAKDHDPTGIARYRRRLQVLDPFNEEIAEVSGVLQGPTPKRRRRLQALAGLVTGHVHTLVQSGVYSLHQVHTSLPRGAYLLAALLVLGGGAGMVYHSRNVRDAVLVQQTMRRSVEAPPRHAPPPSAGAPAPMPAPAPRQSMAQTPQGQSGSALVDMRALGSHARLRIDGRAASVSRSRRLALSPGHHLFEVMLGKKVYRRILTLTAGSALAVRIDAAHRKLVVR